MSKKSKVIRAALDAQKQGLAVDEQALMAQLNPKAMRSTYNDLYQQGVTDPNAYLQNLAVPAQAAAPPVYSQPVQDFINKMMAYETEQQGKGYALNIKDPTIKADMAEGDWQKLIDSNATPEQLYQLGHEFKTNKGNAAGTVFADPDTQYRLRNEKGKDFIVSEGGGLAGLDEIYRQATNLSTTQKKKANWDVEMLNPTTGQWELVAHDDPKKPLGKTLLKVAAIAAPIAGAIFLPMLAPGIAAALGGGMLGASAAAGLGAAGGSILAGAAQGKSLGKIAKGALISGAGGFAGGMLGGAAGLGGAAASGGAGGAAGGAGGAAGGAGGALGSVTSGLGGEIIITGGKLAGSALPGLIGAGAGAAGGALLGSSLGGSTTPSNTLGQGGPYEPVDPNEIVITGNLPPTTLPPDFADQIAAGIGAGVGGAAGGVTSDPNEIVIEGDKTSLADTTPHEGVPGLPTDLLPDNFWDDVANGTAKDAQGNPLDSLDKILNYIKAGMTAAGILGNLAGIGGKAKSAQGKIPPGFFGSSGGQPGGVMGPNLPGANLPNVGMPGGARTMPQQDWYKYGQRPEQSFWNDIPQTYLPPLPGGEDVWGQQARGYARGGEVEADGGSLAVHGPGSGTSDDIPAYLSDGEYVFDAATVNAAGNGSTERGFRVLDNLRVKIHSKGPKKALSSLGVM